VVKHIDKKTRTNNIPVHGLANFLHKEGGGAGLGDLGKLKCLGQLANQR
jgi:hypothetical protein